MERRELEELHYITPICNVPSIMQHGILSHARAARLAHRSVAMPEMQDRRSGVRVPGGRRLHEYANLYVCARNPMLYKRLDQRDKLCVLSISTDVLDLPGVVITDRNAGGEYVQFRASPTGLSIIDRDLTFAEYWTDSSQIEYWRKKAAKCAEVLVPDRVDPGYFQQLYVPYESVRRRVQAVTTGLRIKINRYMFFL